MIRNFKSARHTSRVADGVRERREQRFERMAQEKQTRQAIDSTDWRRQTVQRLRERRLGDPPPPPQPPRYWK